MYELTQELYQFRVVARESVQASQGATNIKTCDVQVHVESANLNSPEFENCPNGVARFSVDENSVIGTFVGNVRAEF